jgi:hypothetical protein
MRTLSRLEKTLFRLQAQHASFAHLVTLIEGRPGIVAELGLGHGRTFDHLRRTLPDREIYVFDHADNAYQDCRPDPAYMIAGDIADTFPPFAERFAGQVILANSDVGSFDSASNARAAALMSRILPPAIAPHGYVMSDLPLTMPGFEQLPTPEGARDGAYYLYRKL